MIKDQPCLVQQINVKVNRVLCGVIRSRFRVSFSGSNLTLFCTQSWSARFTKLFSWHSSRDTIKVYKKIYRTIYNDFKWIYSQVDALPLHSHRYIITIVCLPLPPAELSFVLSHSPVDPKSASNYERALL